jgi:hypothetical protein
LAAISENVQYRLEGSRLVIEIDLSSQLGLSSTRLSYLIAKGQGFVTGGYRFTLTVFRPLTKRELLDLVNEEEKPEEQQAKPDPMSITGKLRPRRRPAGDQ